MVNRDGSAGSLLPVAPAGIESYKANCVCRRLLDARARRPVELERNKRTGIGQLFKIDASRNAGF